MEWDEMSLELTSDYIPMIWEGCGQQHRRYIWLQLPTENIPYITRTSSGIRHLKHSDHIHRLLLYRCSGVAQMPLHSNCPLTLGPDMGQSKHFTSFYAAFKQA